MANKRVFEVKLPSGGLGQRSVTNPSRVYTHALHIDGTWGRDGTSLGVISWHSRHDLAVKAIDALRTRGFVGKFLVLDAYLVPSDQLNTPERRIQKALDEIELHEFRNAHISGIIEREEGNTDSQTSYDFDGMRADIAKREAKIVKAKAVLAKLQ